MLEYNIPTKLIEELIKQNYKIEEGKTIHTKSTYSTCKGKLNLHIYDNLMPKKGTVDKDIGRTIGEILRAFNQDKTNSTIDFDCCWTHPYESYPTYSSFCYDIKCDEMDLEILLTKGFEDVDELQSKLLPFGYKLIKEVKNGYKNR